MGLKVRQHPRGWWMVDIHVELPTGVKVRERKKAPVNTRAQAERWGAMRMAHVLQHGIAPPAPAPTVTAEKEVPTLASFQAEFLESHDRANRHKHSTIVSKASIFRTHLVPALGDRRLDEITTADVQALKGTLHRAAPKTVNDVLSVLKTCLRVARELGRIPPATAPAKIALVKVPDAEMRFYERADFERLVAAAARVDRRAELVVLLAGEAGLRAGEVIALDQTDVDAKRGELTVRRGEWRGVVSSTKGGRSRKVPLTARLAAALAASRHLRGERVLYRNDGATTVSARTIRSWMESAERIAGMPRQTGAMHVLRHTFGARLAMQGAPAKAIMELMGHRSMATTMRYMHLSPAARETAIRLLEGDGGAGNTGNPTATAEVQTSAKRRTR